MRLGWIGFVILGILLTMARTFRCYACSHTPFNTAQGLSNHQRACQEISTWLSRKKEQKATRNAFKVARVDGPDVTQQLDRAQLELLPLPDDEIPKAPPSQVLPPRKVLPSTSSGRLRTCPGRYCDFLPSIRTQKSPFPPPTIPQQNISAGLAIRKVPALSPSWTTKEDTFGLYRTYPMQPSHIPEDFLALEDVCDAPGLARSTPRNPPPPPSSLFNDGQGSQNQFAPFLNATLYMLFDWIYRFGSTSLEAIDSLVHDVLLSPAFQSKDLAHFNARREATRMDEVTPFANKDGWKESFIEIPLPCQGRPQEELTAPKLKVEGVWSRSLCEVIRAAFREPSARSFWTMPWKQFWRQNKDTPPVRVYSETFSSNDLNEEYNHLSKDPDIQKKYPGIEIVIASLMIWSDSTHLTSFGSASLWPIYLYFGNLSMYFRAKPSQFAAHHLAYIPGLPEDIQDIYRKTFGRLASSELLTHLKRELFQAIWLMLLDNNFVEAYKHGMLIVCADGVTRLVFPRFTTYSADYPEQVLIACIKSLAQCLCPVCLGTKEQAHELGTANDMKRRESKARKDDHPRRFTIERIRGWIFGGYSLTSTWVKRALDPKSWTPTKNAFSERLSTAGFDFYNMFVPDVLHGFELGVWKSVFTQLLRLLHALKGQAIAMLDERFRMVPCFGRDTIRRFCANSSEMKKLAARDFEDYLQCAIPVFEGLFPEPHNRLIMELLFTLAEWHAYAKLRMHTETTVTAFEHCTSHLGATVRRFARTTCKTWSTYELPREQDARARREAAKAKESGGSGPSKAPSRRIKKFNMATPKFHSLGHYPPAIRRKGTSNNFNTQTGELEHRRAKRFFRRTNGRFIAGQIAKHTRRERILKNLSNALGTRQSHSSHQRCKFGAASVPFSQSEKLPQTSPDIHYHISDATNFPLDIYPWIKEHKADPAVDQFLPMLREHLALQVIHPEKDRNEVALTNQDLASVIIKTQRLYKHKVLRINYTTYDTRRDQDSINSRTHSDIMMLAPPGSVHPFLYARVLGIFHALIRHRGTEQRLDTLWVRWFTLDTSYAAGWQERRLHRLSFANVHGLGDTFGFVKPDDVVRAAHLIPAFAHGKTSDYMGPSIARREEDKDEDWKYYYVNIFADRDMFMRFRGDGIGHAGSQHLSNIETLSDPPETNNDMEDSESSLVSEGKGENSDVETDQSDLVSEINDSDVGPEDGEDEVEALQAEFLDGLPTL